VLAAAAADGLRRGSTPPAPVTGDASERHDLPALPSTLEGALHAWRADRALRGIVGEGFADYFATTRAWELRAWQESVSDWEHERYERTV
jgi:glutamine synthetase